MSLVPISPRPAHVPKLCGADCELGNFIEGLVRQGGTGHEASRALLREIDGVPGVRRLHAANCACRECLAGGDGRTRYDPRDWGRKFSSANGGCIYIDLDHLEVCLPEVRSARDHVAAWHAALRLARVALARANERQPEGRRIRVLVNNSDGQGSSYGSHLNFLITRRAFENLFERKIHHLLWLASYQVSSIVFTGQGKVGSENGRPEVPFQLSQRADFFECLAAPQTTYNRPIVNSRDEAHCGPWTTDRNGGTLRDEMARLHVIFYDNTLSHVACFLKVGVMQIALAMIEAEEIDPRLILDDPVQALVDWSHDPSLRVRSRTCAGKDVTVVELQRLFLDAARAFVGRGGCVGIVPRADEIVRVWGDTLQQLHDGDFAALAGRLDWVLKRSLLERVLHRRPELDWDDPALKHLDLVFPDLDPDSGLFWRYERDVMERVVSESEIEKLLLEPPADTRAWGRTMLLRRAGPDAVEDVDWDFIKLRTGSGYWPTIRRFDLANPLDFTRSVVGPLLERGGTLEEILDELESMEGDRHGNACTA